MLHLVGILQPRMTMHGTTNLKRTLHVSDSSSLHHQQFFTVHTAMLYVIHVC